MKRTAAAGRVRGSLRVTGAKLMQEKHNLGSSSLTLNGLSLESYCKFLKSGSRIKNY